MKSGEKMKKRDDNIYSRIGIYAIRNIINGKMYIGKTGMNFGDRWDSHRSLLNNQKHDNQYLQNAWNKYGEENFEFIVIEDCCEELLNEREIYYIKKYKDIGLSYNILDGGDGGNNLGCHLSDETKRKIGEKNRVNMLGRKVPESTKAKMSQSHKEYYANLSVEEKEMLAKKSSECAKGYKWNDESKKKMIGNKNGASHSIEEIKYIRKLYEIDNFSNKEISNMLGLTYDYVYRITSYKRWNMFNTHTCQSCAKP